MKDKRKAAFLTLGCKLNFAETATLERSFKQGGYQVVKVDEAPDFVVINTCTVTDKADKKCRQSIRQAIRKAPGAKVAVVGCYAQLKADDLKNIEGVDLVLGNKEKYNILDYLEKTDNTATPLVSSCELEELNEYHGSFSLQEMTRSFLKVQDGCDYFCSYCTIPLARGKSRNNPIGKILEDARQIGVSGAKEVILTGVNIGDFGKSSGESFLDLIKALERVEGIERYRVSSIEPNLLTAEIIDFMLSSGKFLPHFHIPLQSGCDRILGLMKRRYNRGLFHDKVHEIKAKDPYAGIGVDVIVGFPGEKEEDFEDTRAFLQDLPFSYLHVFSYSPRKNTFAAGLSDKVPHPVKEKRSKQLIHLSNEKQHLFYQHNLGRKEVVLFEGKKTKGFIHGFTRNYIKAVAPFEKDLAERTVPVRLTGISPGGDMNVKIEKHD
jgi:threonylcarbamoyladenosine tRNA methylthiotransferase MtaB